MEALSLERVDALLKVLIAWAWGLPLVIAILACGIFFTLYLRFIQFRTFPHSMALLAGHYQEKGLAREINRLKALSAALSGTVGLGNIAGVSVAIAVGGPGAVFWMWVVAFFGMALRFTECSLGSIFREKEAVKGHVHGGPMWYITSGLGEKWKPLAITYAICLFFFAIGGGALFQSNQAASAMHQSFGIPTWITGVIYTILVGATILGGIKRIGQVAEAVVPVMCIGYCAGVIVICIMNWTNIPYALGVIFSDAFSGEAAAGGAIGQVVITGVRRAVFSTGAGIGDASIVYAAVATKHPVRQGVVASLGPFIDTIVICSATAITIILSGYYGTERYEELAISQYAVEPTERFSTDSAWNFTKEGVPPNEDQLRQFRKGEHVLAFQQRSQQQGRTSATTPLIPIIQTPDFVADGIRFSSFHHEGAFSVTLMDEQDTELATFAITDTPQQRQEADTFQITEAEEGWYSHVITFSSEFKERVRALMKTHKGLRLRFEAEGTEGAWYIDRIAAVRQVQGIELSILSFDKQLTGFGTLFVTCAVFLLAFSTMITYAYYAEITSDYVIGFQYGRYVKFLWLACVLFGSVAELPLVINFSDLVLVGAVVTNLIALLFLAPTVKKHATRYFADLSSGAFEK